MKQILESMTFNIILLLAGLICILLGVNSGFTAGSYISIIIADPWARILLIMLGLVGGIVSISLEIKSKFMDGRGLTVTSPLNKSRDLDLPYGKFSEISEREFLDKIDLSKVSHLYVLGHTGQRIYATIHERLQKLISKSNDGFPEEVRILIRAPIVEGLKRNNYIHNTTVAINDLRTEHKNIDVRYYESVPAVRGIICQFRGKEKNRASYVTFYHWPKANSSKAFDFAYLVKDKDTPDDSKPETRILKSWMDQYWGKDEIHTIVFDFDDTLVKTRDVQVKAWAQVIVESLKNETIRLENLSGRFRKSVDHSSLKSATDPTLLETVNKIFIDKQMAEAIAQEIFVDVTDETIKQINRRRFEIREEMMDKSDLFEGAEKMLEKLHIHYNLAIISSTDEQLISNYLKSKNLLEYFPVILGKRDPSLQFEREKIHHKASLLIKLSEIIGMPLNRLVYIGDNNSDYLATRQLGIAFIEARQAAKLVNKTSIITDIDPNKPPLGYFDSFEEDQLVDILRKHSKNLTHHKYQI